MKSFERHVAQVKTYYNFQLVDKSERELLISGLNLLRLLSQHKLAEFHTELELIPVSLHSNMYIKYAIDTDFSLMEGSYHKLRQLNNPAEEYGIFKEILLETVREDIAECSEKAYHFLKLQDATKILLFQNEQETKNFVEKRKWNVENGVIIFKQVQKQELPFEQTSKQLISKTLGYAKEMERII
jgi:26S proteasome regulatory subunit N12